MNSAPKNKCFMIPDKAILSDVTVLAENNISKTSTTVNPRSITDTQIRTLSKAGSNQRMPLDHRRFLEN